MNVAVWEGDGPPILALHGLTSTHHCWSPLANDLRDRLVIAPDLRGRGGSMAMGGPYGLPSHARDVVGLIDEMHLDGIVLVGHSMGAFVAPMVARRAGGRVTRCVLLDGGPPVALPFFLIRPLVRMALRRQAREAGEPFTSVDEALDGPAGVALNGHPDVRGTVASWLDDSAVTVDDGRAAAVDTAAIPVDGVSNFFDREVRDAARNLACPAQLLYAEWGARDGARPFYDLRAAASLARSIPHLTTRQVKAANQLTVLFAPEVRQAVAGA
jgi:pimeloyl-ACP methyl ester carboxylesterase